MKHKIFTSAVLLSSASCSLGFAAAAPFTPETILPDGVNSSVSVNPYTGESGEARKGTIAATLNNVARLNQLLLQKETPESKQEISAISAAVDQLIPSIKVIGLFDMFEPVYWIGEGEQPGRILVLSLYFKRYPEKCTPELRQKLLSLKKTISSPYLIEQLDAL